MKKIKSERSFIEYCFFLTPLLPKFIFKLKRNISRITYIDSDIYFFKNPKPIFEEFKKSKKSFFITLHGFHKDFDKSDESGNFCIQFIIIKNSSKAEAIRNEW